MIYVIVDTDGELMVVHGPFHSEYGALVYYRKLTAHYPDRSFLVRYLIPEKKLPNYVASATPSDIMDVP